MALTKEWRARIRRWKDLLPKMFYRPLGPVALSGFVTTEQLTAEEAARRDFRPMPPGTWWGAKWEYAWFRCEVELPAEAADQRVCLQLDCGGGEALVFIDGRAAETRSWARPCVSLSRRAAGGERFEVLAEAYAGHGHTPCDGGPVPFGVETVPEPGPTQAQIGQPSFGIWEEDLYQLWLDAETLEQLRDHVDADSLRAAEIDQALRDLTVLADLELPRAEMLATVRAARERLQPVLACVNGSTAPTMYGFGHGHLDVAWLWPLAESERKIARTLANQLALVDEYGEHRFLQSQPALYRMLKCRYPALYERVRQAVADGHIIPDGAMWVEADTNVTGGEALIRQILHGRRFFREEFGVTSELLWLPDVFGYSGALPQILRGCGVKYFATAKLYWNYHGGADFPHTTFTWEGIDGSEVRVHLMNNYGDSPEPRNLIQRWAQRLQKDGIATRMFPFGHGDGGGGPTRDHMEFGRRTGDLEGAPRFRMATPMEFFADQERRGWPANRYVGELYLQCHRGTYTTQARIKKGNRKGELALREAEMWASAAAALAGWAVPAGELDEAWKQLLLHQFHDILPGSSIRRVCVEAEAAHAAVSATADETRRSAAAALTQIDAPAVTVFNSLNWPRTELVELPRDAAGAVDSRGRGLAVQHVAGRTLAEVELPPCGWTTLKLLDAQAAEAAPPDEDNAPAATPRSLENDQLRVEFNDAGEITSLFDKVSQRQLAAGPCNQMRMFKDVPAAWDAWDVDSMHGLTPVELREPASIEVLAAGPLVASLRIRRRLNDSEMTQTVSLRRSSRRIDFATSIDWQERHKMLKVAFPVDLHANEAIHEIQFGHIRRPNHYSQQFDADRFEVSNHKWSALAEEGRGFAVLNDCKYGLNVLGGTINLTLLRSPLRPDGQADRGLQVFTYACYAWNGPLSACGVVREAYELNCPPTTAPGSAGEVSLLATDSPSIVVEAVKPAEDRSGDVVVRLYESRRTATRCALTTALPAVAAELTDMLEAPGEPVPIDDGRIVLDFRPFEIKTLRLRLA